MRGRAARRLALAVAGALLAACAATAPPLPAPRLPAPSVPAAPAAGPAADDGARWTGLTLVPVTEALARSRGLERAEGLLVAGVEPGGPGARAGIEEGDVLLLVGGIAITAVDGLRAVLATLPIGSAVGVGLRRGVEPVTAVLPVERPPAGRAAP